MILEGDDGSRVKEGTLVAQFEKQFEAIMFKGFLTRLPPYRRKDNKIGGLLDNPHCYKISNRLGYILFARI
jgi:hypothetical protein